MKEPTKIRDFPSRGVDLFRKLNDGKLPSDFIQIVHQSDCALHNEPALPNGKCDCEPLKMCKRCGEPWCPEVCRDFNCP